MSDGKRDILAVLAFDAREPNRVESECALWWRHIICGDSGKPQAHRVCSILRRFLQTRNPGGTEHHNTPNGHDIISPGTFWSAGLHDASYYIKYRIDIFPFRYTTRFYPSTSTSSEALIKLQKKFKKKNKKKTKKKTKQNKQKKGPEADWWRVLWNGSISNITLFDFDGKDNEDLCEVRLARPVFKGGN